MALAQDRESLSKQEHAVEQIRRIGGRIERDETQRRKPVISLYLPRLEDDSLLKHLGVWDSLESLDLRGALVHGKALACIQKMNHLQSLSFEFSSITDEDAAQFKTPASLRVADFAKTRITGASLRSLRNSKQLSILVLVKCPGVRDAGLEHLERFAELRMLFLAETRVTDAGLRHLRPLFNLQNLALDGTEITDAGLDNLLGLENIGELALSKTKITDAGIARLKALPRLETLYLSETRVTDVGLAELRQLPALRSLELDESQLTIVGRQNLRTLPHLRELMPRGSHVGEASYLKTLKAALPGVSIDPGPGEIPPYPPKPRQKKSAP